MAAAGVQQGFDFDRAPEPASPRPAPEPAVGFIVDIRRSRRRSLSIEVHASLRVIARVPLACPDPVIEAFIDSRRRWIERQLLHFEHAPLAPAACYADGETHHYLGEPLQLRLSPTSRTGVARKPGVLEVGGRQVADAARTARAVQRWFRDEARAVFSELILRWQAHPRFVRYPVPPLKIRLMRTRWGTFSPRTGMTLNLALIHAPIAAIEYVVVHELCHNRYRGHGKGFYSMLEAVLPDWRARKTLLEASIAALAPPT